MDDRKSPKTDGRWTDEEHRHFLEGVDMSQLRINDLRQKLEND